METLKIAAHIGDDGILKLQMPRGVRNIDATIEVSYLRRPLLTGEAWEAFIDRTYGSMADDPIERPDELPEDYREPFE